MAEIDRALEVIGAGLGSVAGSDDPESASVAFRLLTGLNDDSRSLLFRRAVAAVLDGAP